MKRYQGGIMLLWICASMGWGGCTAEQRVRDPARLTMAQLECSVVSWREPANRAADRETGLLDYVERVRQAPTEIQEREFDCVEQSLVQEPNPKQRLRLALLLLLPDSQYRDETRARQLLDEFRTNAGPEEYRPFINLLLSFVDERETEQKAYGQLEQKLADKQRAYRGLKRKLADEQRKREIMQKQLKMLKTLEQRLAEEQKKRKILQKQLEAVKAIETKLKEREKLETLPLDHVEQDPAGRR
jgi:hypothetical protein